MLDGVGAIAKVLRAPALRRLELAFFAFSFSEHATWLAVLIYALRHGGPGTVGVMAAAQLGPGVLLAPFAAYAGDRFPAHKALAFGYATQCAAMTVTAFAMVRGRPLGVYAAATVVATCITFTRPVVRSLMPNVTRTPAELVAVNSVTSSVEQVGMLVGPLLAGAVIAWRSPATMFALAAAIMAGAFVITAMTTANLPANDESTVDATSVLRQAASGFDALRQNGPLRLLVGLAMSVGVARGVCDVAFVTFADARLGGRGWQAGLLGGAYGVGALCGSVLVASLVRSSRVSRPMLICAVALGGSMVTAALAHSWASSIFVFAMIGGSEVLLELLTATTIQRISKGATLARVFGVVEGLLMATTAIGSLALAVLTSQWSLGVALAVIGVLVSAIAIVSVALLRASSGDIEVPDERIIDRLLADDAFAALPAPSIERLARSTEELCFGEGIAVVTQGEQGEHYYLIVDGTASVTIDGEHVRFLGGSRSFGEIALLRDVPRTATVTASTPLIVLAIGRDDFLEVVTGHPRTWRRASQVIDDFDH